nr:hypothetical protein [Mycoplasmopsis bovis]
MLKQKPLKDGEFTVVYPSQEELEKEAKIIRDFLKKKKLKKFLVIKQFTKKPMKLLFWAKGL